MSADPTRSVPAAAIDTLRRVAAAEAEPTQALRELMAAPPSDPTDAQRSARLKLCRAADEFQRALEAMEDATMAAELQNMVALTLRLALRANDGHMSPPDRMRVW